MSALKVHVENGRIKVDEATDLPNGTEVYLVPADQLGDLVLVGGDGLEGEERKRLHESIRRGIEDGQNGRVADFDQVVVELEAET